MVLLQMARALAIKPEDPSKTTEVHVILDSGSQKSFITDKVKRLKSLNRGPLSIMTFGSSKEKREVCEAVRVRLHNQDGEDQEIQLLTVSPIRRPSTQLCIDRYDHLRGIKLVELEEEIKPDILIGSDHYWEFLTGEIIRGKEGPVAVHSQLGWILSGPVMEEDANTSVSLVTHVLGAQLTPAEVSKNLDTQLRAFWDLESFGIEAKETSVLHSESTVRFVNRRYEVNLPWKDPDVTLSDNYDLCLRRLRALLWKLRKETDIMRKYEAVMEEQLENGIIEELQDPSMADGQPIQYLPHHAVVRCDKDTTKLRVVYDASARSDGMSLNDCLHVGPKFNQRIFDILVRFRAHRVALTGDIEKAFLMVSVAKDDGCIPTEYNKKF